MSLGKVLLLGICLLCSVDLLGENFGSLCGRAPVFLGKRDEDVVISSAGEGTISYELQEEVSECTNARSSDCVSPCVSEELFCNQGEDLRWLFQVGLGYWGSLEWGVTFADRPLLVQNQQGPIEAKYVFYGFEPIYPKVSKGLAFILEGSKTTSSGAGVGFFGAYYSAGTKEKYIETPGGAGFPKVQGQAPIFLVPTLIRFWGKDSEPATEIVGSLDLSVKLGEIYCSRNVYCQEDNFLLLGHFGVVLLKLESDLNITATDLRSKEKVLFGSHAVSYSWGWGPAVGFYSSIFLGKGAALFGDFDVSLLSLSLEEDCIFSKGAEKHPYTVQIPAISPLMHVRAGLKVDCTFCCASWLDFQVFWEQWVGMHMLARSLPGHLEVKKDGGKDSVQNYLPAVISAHDVMFGGPSAKLTLCF